MRLRAADVQRNRVAVLCAKAIEKPRFKTLCEAWLAVGGESPEAGWQEKLDG